MKPYELLLVSVFARAATSAVISPFNSSPLVKRATSPDGTCGPQSSGQYTCPTGWTRCCSQWGWCGDSPDHCGAGCQSGFGACDGTNPPNPTPTTTNPPNPSPTGGPTGREQIGDVPYGVRIDSCSQPGHVALTFDDGPHVYTETLLNTLSQKGVKATFFINGMNFGADINSDTTKQNLIRRMIADGHQVASHTWSHADLSTLSANDISSQMTLLENSLLNIIGKYPTYMRPPYLSCSQTCLNTIGQLGYHLIFTDLDTQDWQFDSANGIQNSKDIFAGAVNPSSPSQRSWLPLEHDVHFYTVQSLVPFMIDTFKAKGFTGVTVGECMGDPETNWYRTSQ